MPAEGGQFGESEYLTDSVKFVILDQIDQQLSLFTFGWFLEVVFHAFDD